MADSDAMVRGTRYQGTWYGIFLTWTLVDLRTAGVSVTKSSRTYVNIPPSSVEAGLRVFCHVCKSTYVDMIST